MFYQKEEFQLARRKARFSRILIALGVALSFAAGLIPMLLSRNLFLSTVLSIAMAVITVFFYGTMFSRALSYQRFMRMAEEGIRHDITGSYVERGGENVRDGVPFIILRFAVNAGEEPRQCYYDRTLPPASLTEGARYTVTHTGNLILGIRPAEMDGGRDA